MNATETSRVDVVVDMELIVTMSGGMILSFGVGPPGTMSEKDVGSTYGFHPPLERKAY